MLYFGLFYTGRSESNQVVYCLQRLTLLSQLQFAQCHGCKFKRLLTFYLIIPPSAASVMVPTEERTILFVLLTFLPIFGHALTAIVSKAQLRAPTTYHNPLMMSSSSLLFNPKVNSYSPRLLTPLGRDKESYYTPVQIISNRGYPVQVHSVTTDDGFVIIILHKFI